MAEQSAPPPPPPAASASAEFAAALTPQHQNNHHPFSSLWEEDAPRIVNPFDAPLAAAAAAAAEVADTKPAAMVDGAGVGVLLEPPGGIATASAAASAAPAAAPPGTLTALLNDIDEDVNKSRRYFPPSLTASYRSTTSSEDFTCSERSTSTPRRMSSLQGNLMRAQKLRDPFKIYEVLEILGEGSMGRVSRVRKRKDAVGGSARPSFVLRQKGGDCCYPFLACLHQFFPRPTQAFLAAYSGAGAASERPPQASSEGTINSSELAELPDPNALFKITGWSSSTHKNNSKPSPPYSGGGNKKTGASPLSTGDVKQYASSNNLLTNSGRSVSTFTSGMSSTEDQKHHHSRRTNKGTTKHNTLKKKSSLISFDTTHSKEVTYALKSIHLNRCSTPVYIEELKNEVEIMKGLDHPNIVRAIETFDYRNRLYIVLELCSGGDLYTREPYTEYRARNIVAQLLSAVTYLHGKGIVHRDLKFENIMFVHARSYDIKLIDFGLSQKFAKEQHLHDQVGTVYTMAPELLAGDYTSQADVWSTGVISFMLLSSSMPFYGQTRVSVIKKILKGKYRFSARKWSAISQPARDYVAACLTMDPNVRPTAAEAQLMPWFRQSFEREQSSSSKHNSSNTKDNSVELISASEHTTTNNNNNDTSEDYMYPNRVMALEQMDQIQTSILSFSGYSQLKKLALLIVAYQSSSEEIGFLRNVFNQFDSCRDGEISFREFSHLLCQHYDYTEEECLTMFRGLDVDGTGKVHYTEFLAATLESLGMLDELRLAEAFDRLDCDDDGYISAKNLREFLGPDVPEVYISSVLEEADTNGDHKIAYEEFMQLWSSEDDEALSMTRLSVASRHLTPTPSFLSSISDHASSLNSVGSIASELERAADIMATTAPAAVVNGTADSVRTPSPPANGPEHKNNNNKKDVVLVVEEQDEEENDKKKEEEKAHRHHHKKEEKKEQVAELPCPTTTTTRTTLLSSMTTTTTTPRGTVSYRKSQQHHHQMHEAMESAMSFKTRKALSVRTSVAAAGIV